MSKSATTYKLRWIVSAMLIWELIFWVLYYLFTQFFSSITSAGSSERLLFKSPDSLYYLAVLIPIAGVYLFNLLRNNKMAEGAKSRVAKSYLKEVSTTNSFVKYFLFRNAFVFLVFAMAQPVFGTKKVAGTTESLELVIALDISNSMNTRDISDEISRLDISKRAMIQLINNLHGEKIGICLFANNAFVQLPITSDYGAAKLFIEDIETDMISSQGTNVKEALEVSLEMFSEEETTKGIIMITDGENHEQNPDAILTKIKESNVQLSVLGIGTTKGGLVPKNPKRPELGYKTNAVGRSVVSRLDEKFIRSIASKSGGKATISAEEFPNLSALLTQINQMKRTKINTLEFDIKQERYQVPLLISLIFWLTFILWSKNYNGFLKGRTEK